jgi:hypothetical protein
MSNTTKPLNIAKSKRGGARPGAGQYTKIEDLRRINITVQGEDIERARTIGDGNVSLGIRIAVRRAIK